MTNNDGGIVERQGRMRERTNELMLRRVKKGDQNREWDRRTDGSRGIMTTGEQNRILGRSEGSRSDPLR